LSLAPIGLHHFLILGTILFSLGLFGALSRRNAVAVLLSIELMLNGVNVVFISMAKFINSGEMLAGQVFAMYVITVAAAEAAVGLALVLAIYRQRRTVQVDQLDVMKG
jgi:NADH-quinone oxidoreductase subunit K